MCHRELGPFLGENTLFLGEGTLLLGGLGPFPKENSLFVGEVFLTPYASCFSWYFICSLRIFLIPWELHSTPLQTYVVF